MAKVRWRLSCADFQCWLEKCSFSSLVLIHVLWWLSHNGHSLQCLLVLTDWCVPEFETRSGHSGFSFFRFLVCTLWGWILVCISWFWRCPRHCWADATQCLQTKAVVQFLLQCTQFIIPAMLTNTNCHNVTSATLTTLCCLGSQSLHWTR